jgi:hypothetical protein
MLHKWCNTLVLVHGNKGEEKGGDWRSGSDRTLHQSVRPVICAKARGRPEIDWTLGDQRPDAGELL